MWVPVGGLIWPASSLAWQGEHLVKPQEGDEHFAQSAYWEQEVQVAFADWSAFTTRYI